MEKLTPRKQAVLDVLDAQIEDLDTKLAKYQPLFDELGSLRATRARLLDERSTTSGGGRRGSQLTMETVILFLREEGASSVADIAKHAGVDPSIVRSHLNRHKDVRYRQDEDGDWELIGEEDE
jgi:hypothetical protein